MAEQERRKSSRRESCRIAFLRLALECFSDCGACHKSNLRNSCCWGRAETHLVVHAPIGGTVIGKEHPCWGQYVREGGDWLYTIADLRQVWLVLEIYESELSWVCEGQPVQVKLESAPAHPVTGRVAFVEPLLNQATSHRGVCVSCWTTRPASSSWSCNLRRPAFTFRSCRTAARLPATWKVSTSAQCTLTISRTSPATCAQCNMPRERFPSRHADLYSCGQDRSPCGCPTRRMR